ncbi:MAG: Hsp20/alpha crystallin family protein [Desulfovibrionaceae bacterium]|nr:Hsp20/alpha crystallin family protein [Desulfovibrionaceae bacterium]
MLPGIFGENLIDTFFGGRNFSQFHNLTNHEHVSSACNLMKTDVRELDKTYELDVDLPGFEKENINLELDGGYLTITAAKEEASEEGKGQYLRRERYCGSCSRSFFVGEDLEPKDVAASFESGVLKVSFPKNPEKKVPEAKRIAIA